MRKRLDALRDDVRQPLTDFEQREADRQQAIHERINAMSAELPKTSAESDSCGEHEHIERRQEP